MLESRSNTTQTHPVRHLVRVWGELNNFDHIFLFTVLTVLLGRSKIFSCTCSVCYHWMFSVVQEQKTI